MAGFKSIFIFLLLCGFSAAAFDSPVYNIRDFGASGNKNDDATTAIQQAIDSASAIGGGTVLIPRGEYLSRQLRLYSNITLHVDADAIIYADIKNPAFKGGSLIYA